MVINVSVYDGVSMKFSTYVKQIGNLYAAIEMS